MLGILPNGQIKLWKSFKLCNFVMRNDLTTIKLRMSSIVSAS